MRLAVLELARERRRFVAVTITLVLINILLLFLVSQLTGLLRGQSGALENQESDILVYEKGVEQSLFRSVLPASDAPRLEAVPGVAAAGPLGVLFGAGSENGGDLFDLAIFGFGPGRPGAPLELSEGRLPERGETNAGAIDASAKSDGIELGDTVTFGDSGLPIEVVGFVEGTQFQLQPVLWVDISTWRAVRDAAQPELATQTPDVNVFAVETEASADPDSVTTRIDSSIPDVEALTTPEAVDALPGYSEQRQTFFMIIAVTYIAAALVVTLFFVLVTLEKTYQLGVLKALGARTVSLVGSTAAQGAILSIVAFAVGAGLVALAGVFLAGSVPFEISLVPWLVVFVLTVVVGAIGGLVSTRRIARIDPAVAVSDGG